MQIDLSKVQYDAVTAKKILDQANTIIALAQESQTLQDALKGAVEENKELKRQLQETAKSKEENGQA